MTVAIKDSEGEIPPQEELQMVPLVIHCVLSGPNLKHIQPHMQ